MLLPLTSSEACGQDTWAAYATARAIQALGRAINSWITRSTWACGTWNLV